MDLGITGWDQVQEYEARVRSYNRTRRASLVNNPDEPQDLKVGGCDLVMNLSFGACKLQVQVPEKGVYTTTQDLIGKTIGTSFVDLAAEHFAKLEMGLNPSAEGAAPTALPKKLRTKIIELSGSVEAACALGVADGIVDLVGTSFLGFP